jgi:hypothetical protein
MRRKNIIPLVQYSHPEERITKQIREETNNKFYKKLNSLKANKITIKKLSPIRRIQKNYSLPKLNLRLSSINDKEKEKAPLLKEREKEIGILSYRDKYFNKFMTFEERMILNFYENAISQRMRAKPKRINDMFFKQFKSNFQKSKENYRKIDEMRLIKENSIYKKGIKRYSDYYANFSNKFMDKSLLGLRNKIRLKII